MHMCVLMDDVGPFVGEGNVGEFYESKKYAKIRN